jgi:hypothetical protein
MKTYSFSTTLTIVTTVDVPDDIADDDIDDYVRETATTNLNKEFVPTLDKFDYTFEWCEDGDIIGDPDGNYHNV